MQLGLVSCIGEVVCAFFGGVGAEQFADCGGQGFDGSGGGFAQEMLELGEDLLDWVQVGRIFGQEEELGAGRSDRLADGAAFVTAEIVHDDQIARLEGGREHFLDVGLERLAIDGAIEQPRRFNPVAAKRRDKGHGFPMAVGNAGHKPFAARRPAAKRLHIGFRPGLIDEHQTPGLDLVLPLLPLRPPSRDVGPFALARHDAFF
jgi:hypothetical protein